ncbi:MAG TPA: 5'/3'-nucleotidase SurE [Aggregatilineaceae bacterium]|jgi:5'-nucleotidase|nr:5'/3'-nucleotidase SurE [Aggregatilineaceae bacterium]
MERPLILLTNDDGIHSPGLAAAAAALDPVGDLLIVSPSVQQSGMGRSFPNTNDGRLVETTVTFDGQWWKGYSANASPAQCVQHGALELADRPLALVVSGINYGENVGTGVTGSGTVGAALEAASYGIPALAVSLEVDPSMHFTNDDSVEFGPAIHFTRLFASRWLAVEHPPDVDVLKIDIPASATPDTPWRMTRLERGQYFVALPPLRRQLGDEGRIGYTINQKTALDSNSDVAAVRNGFVSVTPLTLDLTSRVDPNMLHNLLNHTVQ